MIRVSVIVPVYNVEKYLERCIESLINQTLKDIEFILVDDGSTDDSGVMCDIYAKKYANVKVIHKENQGLGFARNSGLDVASGEYVAFADSDDYVAVNIYEKLYEHASVNNADICMCGLNRVYANGTIDVFENPIGKAVYKEKIFENILINLIGAPPSYPFDDYMGMSACNAIYLRNIIVKNKVRFCSEREFISEDIIFHTDYFKWVKTFAVISDALYYYCKNEDSLTTSYMYNRFERYKYLYFELQKRLKELGVFELAKYRIDRTFIANSRVCIIQEVLNSKKNDFKTAEENIYDICCDTNLQVVLSSYPILQLPLKQRVFSICTKLKLVKTLFVLVELNTLI